VYLNSIIKNNRKLGMQLDSSSESFHGFPVYLIDHGLLLCYRFRKERIMKSGYTPRKPTFFGKSAFYLFPLLIATLLFTSCEFLEDLFGGGNEDPVASFIYDKSFDLAPETVDFDATASHDPDGNIVDYAWDFGDGETGTGDITSHDYATTGPFSVTLTVTDDEGATGNATETVTFAEGIMWTFESDKPVYYSSPAVASDGTIYFGTGIYIHTDSGSLYALNPDGTEKWKRDLDLYPNPVYPKGDNGFSPAIGSDGTIYIQGATSALYAYDPQGNRLWKYDSFDNYPFASEVGQRTPAINLDGTLYVSADALYALYPDGTRKWRFVADWGCRASPAIGPDGTIYVMGGQDMLFAVNPDGTEKWVFLLDLANQMSFASPTVDTDGTIYIAAEDFDTGFLYAVNSNGTRKWCYTVPGSYRVLRSSPAIAPDGTIYVGTKSGGPGTPAQLLAFYTDGTLKWAFDVPQVTQTADDIYCSPTVATDGTIYFGAETGSLYSVNPDGTLKWSLPLQGGNNWSSPALLNDGTLYIGSHQTTWEGEWIGHLFAIKTTSLGLAVSPWPKFRKNNRNTGRFGD
jgi:outer membrane protein assembly factor BamB